MRGNADYLADLVMGWDHGADDVKLLGFDITSFYDPNIDEFSTISINAEEDQSQFDPVMIAPYFLPWHPLFLMFHKKSSHNF